MADHRARPVGLFVADVDILLIDVGTGAVRTPAPDVAVGAVGGRLAGIEASAVELSLLVVGEVLVGIVETLLQVFV